MRARAFCRVVGVAVAITMVGVGSGVIEASTPPSPAPYPHVDLQGSGPPDMTCLDPTSTAVYVGPAWTLEPLLRGPLFAPTVLFLEGVGGENRPVAPLRFTSTAYPIVWSTVDAGPLLSGTVDSVAGRPTGYGPTATTNEPMITCSYSLVGHEDFGRFVITKGLQQSLSLPTATIGRTLAFDGEGDVRFETRQSQFPLIAENYDPLVQPWLVPDVELTPWTAMPTITCRDGARVVYRGAAKTLAPVVRGFDWAPMAFWIAGDRIVTPHWSRLAIEGTWETVEGEPFRSGVISQDLSFTPAGVGANPYPTSKVIDCTWRVVHDEVINVSAYLLVQLELPTRVATRNIHIASTSVVHAYVPKWLFPPTA